MSRLDELKKQYPELNFSVIDLLRRIDKSKSYKYLPLLCKLFSKRYRYENISEDEKFVIENDMYEWAERLDIDKSDLTQKEYLSLRSLSDWWGDEFFKTISDFMRVMDKNLLENNDVTSYNTIDDLRAGVTLASIKEYTKILENEVHKEYEDSTWLMVRPLTFLSSIKYGANTKWCTTYTREKQYFEKYWRNGILVYFINKKNGYKFAGFKALNGEREFSFWNAEDHRVDFLDTEVDDYLFKIVKDIFKSNKTNKELSSDEIQDQVHQECLSPFGKIRFEPEPVALQEPVPEMYFSELEMDTNGISETPTMRA